MSVTAKQVQELMEDHSRQYPSPTDPYMWITTYDYQAIADELNAAMVGCDTCRMETDDSCQNWNSCSECGADYYADQPINYCPNCGRKVVDE